MDAFYVLDIRTLMVVVVCLKITQALVLVVVWRAHRDYAPAREWALGALILAFGMFLIGQRSAVPHFVAVLIGNIAHFTGIMIFNFGIARAAGQRPPYRKAFVLLAFITLTLYFTRDNLFFASYRNGVYTSIYIVLYSYSSISCLLVNKGRSVTSFRALGIAIAVLMLITWWRGWNGVHTSHDIFLNPTPDQVVFFIYAICYFLASSTILVLITSQRLQDELERIAQRDPLTGALNRRAFDELVQREWLLSCRHDHPLSCLMLDIDHFKRFNDQHGHAVGDEVLRLVAGAVQSVLRQEDVLCRYGGEEFVVLLPYATSEAAALVAERIRAQITATPVTTKHERVHVTASIGIAEKIPGDDSWQNVMSAADFALYAAKHDGRNRVRVLERGNAGAGGGATGAENSRRM